MDFRVYKLIGVFLLPWSVSIFICKKNMILTQLVILALLERLDMKNECNLGKVFLNPFNWLAITCSIIVIEIFSMLAIFGNCEGSILTIFCIKNYTA